MSEYYQIAIKLVKHDPSMITLVNAEKCHDHYIDVVHAVFEDHKTTTHGFCGLMKMDYISDTNYKVMGSIDFTHIPSKLHHTFCQQAIQRNPFELEYIDPDKLEIKYSLLCQEAMKLDADVFRFLKKDSLEEEKYLDFAIKAIAHNHQNILNLDINSEMYTKIVIDHIVGGDGAKYVSATLLDYNDSDLDELLTSVEKNIFKIPKTKDIFVD